MKTIQRILVTTILVTGLATSLFAYDPTPGGETAEILSGPLLLSQSGAGGSQEAIAGDPLNPAASALKQRIHLDGAYLGIVGDGEYAGHAAHLGLAYPTPTGVFSGSLGFVSSDYADLDLGQRANLNLAFSKDLYPRLLFGAGIRGFYGSNSGETGFAGGIDLGFIHLAGTKGPFQDLSWGFSLSQLGIGYKPGDVTGSPSPFTPAFSAEARLFESDAADLDLAARLRFPSFQNVTAHAGASLTLFDRVTVHTGWDVNLREQTGGTPASLVPSVGISVLLQTDIRKPGSFVAEQGWSKSDIAIRSAFAPLYDGVYATGAGTNIALGVVDRDPPAITVDYEAQRYISANNDGASDDLLLPVTITDSRYVKGWTLDVYDDQGTLVRSIENKEQRPENATFSNILARLLYVKQGVDVPTEIRWDGRTGDGTIAPDGAYHFSLTAFDDNANESVTTDFALTLDATPPAVSIAEPETQDELIFSPNGDGNKDTIVVGQNGSEEDEWTIQVLDVDDIVVREQTVAGSLSDFVWDGRDGQGALVPDGVYAVRSFATDRAQNSGEATLANIIVNTEPTPIGLTLSRSQISPNGDGVGDTLTVTPAVPVVEGIREWTYRLMDSTGTVVNSTTGGATMPTAWTVTGRNAAGAVVAEGRYTAELTIRYNTGNVPVAVTPPVTVDLSPPFAAAQADVEVFSPNGDGRIDSVTIVQTADQVETWTGNVVDTAGESVHTWVWSSQPEPKLIWDGRNDAGDLLPDGIYRYTVSGRDAAGNLTVTPPVPITLDTRETPVFVSTDYDAFSPNGDSEQDQLAILPELKDRRGVDSFTITVTDADDQDLATITGRGAPDTRLDWDGRLPSGGIVRDGAYRIRLQVDYTHGNRAVALSPVFIVDTVAPNADVRLADTIFSPDGDGNKDELDVLQTSSPEDLWTGTVLARNGSELRRFESTGALADFLWDGTDDTGNRVPDGQYRYVTSAVDAAGNRFTSRPVSFSIDTAPVEIRLTQSETAFSPNGDDTKDSVTLTPLATSEDPIESWVLRIISADSGRTVLERPFPGGFEPFSWRGEADRGTAPDGLYRAEIETRFVKGSIEKAGTARAILLDRQAPTARVTLSSEVFSPNGDGYLDSLSVTQQGSDEQRWVATVSDATGRLVRSFEWVRTPAGTVEYDGLASGRTRLPDGTYTYELFSTDEAGNYGTSSPQPFEISTLDTPLSIFSDIAAFSPNGDGTNDRITFTPRVGLAEGITAYSFSVVDAADKVVFERSGRTVPESITWDGAASGARAPDGQYRASIALVYRHGNRPSADTEAVLLDTQPPAITVSSDFPVFSPDGDGRRDAITISQQSDPAEQWLAEIRDASDSVVRTFSWGNRVEPFVWDGTDGAGNRLVDGWYTYVVTGRDLAGNAGTGFIQNLEIDTVPARLYVTIDVREFSPNGDGVRDNLTIRLITSRTDGAVSRTVDIIDSGDRVIRTWEENRAQAREEIVWDGRTAQGQVRDGTYRVRYRVALRNGTLAETLSGPLRLDVTPPALSAELRGLPFSPDNDSLNDELGIVLSAVDAGAIAQWEFVVLDRNRRPFQRFEGRGTPRPQVIWDGRSGSGELVISAEDYPYRFSATDSVGNASVVEGVIPIDILVIRDGDRLKVQISNINFEPNSPVLQLDASTEAGRKNIAVLDRLVEVFDKYASYQIRIEGHAVNITGTEKEEREELQPLSLSRAETVRTALIARGMEPDRITVLGRGGTEPIVPHTDAENRWKNRRVEFILIR